MHELKGLYTAMITPFTEEGTLDLEGLRQNIHFQLESGVDGIVALGTTAESPTLSTNEKNSIVITAREETEGKIPLMVGTGTNSTEQTIENTRLAAIMGADIALVVTPYYNRPTQEGLIHHFTSIAQAVQIPILLYNHPGRCGTPITLETAKTLAKIPNIIGIKDASGNISQMDELVREIENFSVLSGDDLLTFPLIALGGEGVISVASNLIPQEVKALVDASLKGDLHKARTSHQALCPLFQTLNLDSNPIPIKAAMAYSGMPAGSCRAPLYQMKPKHFEQLKPLIPMAAHV